uniref:Uncharacterized protein n=1 Tax=Salix viminalis TaxID=40686 RepID=A0A6N2KCM4_SALVM
MQQLLQEVASAVDSHFLCEMEEPLETPIINDLIMVSGSESRGCLIAPTLSIGSLLLQRAAITASFHDRNAEIVESRANPIDFSSMDAAKFLKSLSNMGQICSREGICTDIVARGQALREDGDRVHSMVLPWRPYSAAIFTSLAQERNSRKNEDAEFAYGSGQTDPLNKEG